jgi:energy-converting hydrogenase Eha subunit E
VAARSSGVGDLGVYLDLGGGGLNNAGTLVSLRDSLNLERLEAWSVILLGAGLILLGEIAVRLAMPVYRRPIVGTLILAVILIGAGVQQITNKDVVWALALIAIGIGLLFRGAFRGNRL